MKLAKKLMVILLMVAILFPFVNAGLSYAIETNITKENEVKSDTKEAIQDETKEETEKTEEENTTKGEITDKEEKEDNKIEENTSDFEEEQEELEEIEKQEETIEMMKSKVANNRVELEQGTYQIFTSLDSQKLLDVQGVSTVNSANIQIWEKSTTISKNQMFEIIPLENGYYTIQALHSGKVLDVAGAGTTNGTKVQQYTSNGSDAQQWQIMDAGNGYVSIVSKCNGLYLDVKGANRQNGTLVQMYEGNATNSQKFKLVLQEERKGTKTIEDGIYHINMAANTKIGLDIASQSKQNGANVQLWENSQLINHTQMFQVQYLGDKEGAYTIMAVGSKKVLDVTGAGMGNGTNVQQYESNHSDAQKWIIKKNGESYQIISKLNGLCLDIAGGSIKNGSNVQVWEENHTKAQEFIFQDATLKGEQVIPDGIYKIATKLNTSMVLDVAGGSYSNSANVQIWKNDDVQQKKYELTYHAEENGYYEIKAVHSGKVLDVAGGRTTNGANVQQYTSNQSEAQKWIIQETGNGSYYIISKSASLYLDIAGGQASNGSNVQLYEGNGTTAQQFSITETKIINEDDYAISVQANPDKMFDIEEASLEEGARLQIWQNNNLLQQRFDLKYAGDGYYKIVAKISNQVLTVGSDEKSIIQQKDKNLDSQKWKIEIAGNGYYYIKSKLGNLYMDLPGNLSHDGNKIQVYEKNGTNAQKFTFTKITVLNGIDVSTHQGLIDWRSVKQSGTVDFAIIRCGYGRDTTEQDDPFFERNVLECERLGIPYGVYLYSYAGDREGGKSEAEHVLRLLKGRNPAYGIWIDIEDADGYKIRNGIAYETGVEVGDEFCKTLKAAGYSNVGIYASLTWLNGPLNNSMLDSYPKWVAQWNTVCEYQKSYVMWQYTSSGQVSGIVGNVDMDLYYKK